MPSRQWKQRINDILQAIHAISEDTRGMSLEQFQNKPSISCILLHDDRGGCALCT